MSLFLAALFDAATLPHGAVAAIDIGAAAPPARAASPLRKHKRKAAQPHRSALDTASVGSAGSDLDDLRDVESPPKERRCSASPPAVPRQPRQPRAATSQSRVQQAAVPAAPAPEQLAAVFDAAAPPPFLAAAIASGTAAQKICVQCGTTATPMWRQVNGLTYCNADGLRLKRRLGLL